ncbi:alpha/beta fold hydrolase [Pelagibius sp. Alg239-R121]|uniref:alpha/beta fold hydrolase n=1 Tax=Pelagibius sp. Alg239-R121 TaxID=2993448 RepID=UPI0024A62E7F|nr:alpha/beta hydrolase [Pelagibius sp. Alg239-R121]
MTLEDAGSLIIDDADLEYRMIGPRPDEAPTIVLLHEGLGCTAMWRNFPEQLARATGLGVFVYSRQGYGGSSPCEVPRSLAYMHDEAIQVLPKLLDAIGFTSGLLVGHSDGASIAAIHAGAIADPRILGLVLMAPHFFTEDMGIAAIAETKVTFETTDLRTRLQKYHGDNVDCAFWGWIGAWLDPEFRNWDLRDFLPTITVPVIVLQGLEDQYGTAAQVCSIEELCGGEFESLFLSNCAHTPFREQPEQTLAAISRFTATLFDGDEAANIRQQR